MLRPRISTARIAHLNRCYCLRCPSRRNLASLYVPWRSLHVSSSQLQQNTQQDHEGHNEVESESTSEANKDPGHNGSNSRRDTQSFDGPGWMPRTQYTPSTGHKPPRANIRASTLYPRANASPSSGVTARQSTKSSPWSNSVAPQHSAWSNAGAAPAYSTPAASQYAAGYDYQQGQYPPQPNAYGQNGYPTTYTYQQPTYYQQQMPYQPSTTYSPQWAYQQAPYPQQDPSGSQQPAWQNQTGATGPPNQGASPGTQPTAIENEGEEDVDNYLSLLGTPSAPSSAVANPWNAAGTTQPTTTASTERDVSSENKASTIAQTPTSSPFAAAQGSTPGENETSTAASHEASPGMQDQRSSHQSAISLPYTTPTANVTSEVSKAGSDATSWESSPSPLEAFEYPGGSGEPWSSSSPTWNESTIDQAAVEQSTREGQSYPKSENVDETAAGYDQSGTAEEPISAGENTFEASAFPQGDHQTKIRAESAAVMHESHYPEGSAESTKVDFTDATLDQMFPEEAKSDSAAAANEEGSHKEDAPSSTALDQDTHQSEASQDDDISAMLDHSFPEETYNAPQGQANIPDTQEDDISSMLDFTYPQEISNASQTFSNAESSAPDVAKDTYYTPAERTQASAGSKASQQTSAMNDWAARAEDKSTAESSTFHSFKPPIPTPPEHSPFAPPVSAPSSQSEPIQSAQTGQTVSPSPSTQSNWRSDIRPNASATPSSTDTRQQHQTPHTSSTPPAPATSAHESSRPLPPAEEIVPKSSFGGGAQAEGLNLSGSTAEKAAPLVAPKAQMPSLKASRPQWVSFAATPPPSSDYELPASSVEISHPPTLPEAPIAPPPSVRKDRTSKTSYSNPQYVVAVRKLLEETNRHQPDMSVVFDQAKKLAREGYAPTVEMYSALTGCIAKQKDRVVYQHLASGLLEEMKSEGLQPNSTIYHNILKILAVSPDFLTRERVLEEMRLRWITLTTEGVDSVILGLLTDGQLERALEIFETRRANQDAISKTMYLETIKALGRASEVDEALRIGKDAIEDHPGRNFSIVWFELLNVTSSCLHLEGTLWIWNTAVKQKLFSPDDGVLLKVLNTAARNGSPQLAGEVLRMLNDRGRKIEEAQFNALITAFARGKNLPMAFRTIQKIREADITPSPTTSSSLADAITADGSVEAVDEAYFALKDLHGEASASAPNVVDLIAFNAVVEACVRLGDMERALGVFNDASSLGVEPTTETFNLLFTGCLGGWSERLSPLEPSAERPPPPQKELAMFLAGEMKVAGKQPDMRTYEALLQTSLYQDDYEDAFMYLEEMKSMHASIGKVRVIVYQWIGWRLFEAEDERIEILLDEMAETGYGAEANRINKMVLERTKARVVPAATDPQAPLQQQRTPQYNR